MNASTQTQQGSCESEQSSCCTHGLCRMICECFKGPTRWMAVLAFVYLVIFTAVAVFAAIGFFGATQTRGIVGYATLFLAALMCAIATKLWLWTIMMMKCLVPKIEQARQACQSQSPCC